MPYIWAHEKYFQIAMVVQEGETCTIDILDYEVRYTHTKLKSFYVPLWKGSPLIKSFSPTTHHISISANGRLAILDVQNSRILLWQEMMLLQQKTGLLSDGPESHSFSGDGSLFAASLWMTNIYVWKYTSNCYALLKKISCRGLCHFQFSPTSPLIPSENSVERQRGRVSAGEPDERI